MSPVWHPIHFFVRTLFQGQGGQEVVKQVVRGDKRSQPIIIGRRAFKGEVGCAAGLVDWIG